MVCPKIKEASEKWLETADNSINQIQKLCDRLKDQLSFSNLRLAERYIKSELKILMRMSVIGGSGQIGDFIAHFERDKSVAVEREYLSGCDLHSEAIHTGHNRKQEPVLIDYVEVMEQPKIAIQSVVRLYRAQDFFGTHSHSVYFSLSNRRCILLGTIANREIGVLVGRSATSLNKLPREVIECTSKVMNRVPENKRHVVGDGLDLRDKECRVFDCGYRMRLGAKSIWFGIKKPLNRNVQVTDVLFGPFNLEPNR